MKVVIFERDLSPLTIIDLPESLLEAGVGRGFIRMAVTPRLDFDAAMDLGRTARHSTFSIEVTRLRLHEADGFCIVSHDNFLRTWLMPPAGLLRTPAEFLRNRDEFQRALHQDLARGLGGH